MILNQINNLITNIKQENKSEGSLLRDYTDGNTYSIYYINKMENSLLIITLYLILIGCCKTKKIKQNQRSILLYNKSVNIKSE